MTQDQQGIQGNLKLKATSDQRRVGWVVFLVVGLCLTGVGVLEAAKFDIGRLFMPCGFKVDHGLPCPTCGYTTALRAFATGHVVSAFKIQPAAGLICLGLLVSAIMGLYVAVSGHYPHWLRRGLAQCSFKQVLLLLVVVILLGWTVGIVQAMAQNT